MPLRLAITKATAQGEQLVVDCCQWNPVTGEICHSVEDTQQLFTACLASADVRIMEMNTRMLEAYDLERYFAPAVWHKIIAILDVLAGRQSAATVAARWASEVEETAELERGRQLYTMRQHQQNGIAVPECPCDYCTGKVT